VISTKDEAMQVFSSARQIFNMILGRRRELPLPEEQSLPRKRTTMRLVNPKQECHGIVTATSVEKALSLPLESRAVTQ